MSVSTSSISETAINTIRTLSMDAVQAANSGHPGTPMALAPLAYHLWNNVMQYNPADPTWAARDRFVLSCGHASMLLYSMLHLTEVRQVDSEGLVLDEPAVSLDEIRNFRQMNSRTPGHPEQGHTGGVETTTGPLGQGIANSVGMAIAASSLAANYNKEGFELFNFNTYTICSDGDLMEGISQEAASLAGHLKLSNLCWIYDDNKITIEGNTDLAFSEKIDQRFLALGWNVVQVDDANDLEAFSAACQNFIGTDDRPTLIIVRSTIAWGSPNKQDTHGAHGAPLGEDEIQLTKAAYNWPTDQSFVVPEEVIAHFRACIGSRGSKAQAAWNAKFAEYEKAHPQLAQEWKLINAGELPEGWDTDIPQFETDVKGMASRSSSGKVLNTIAKNIPWMLGGSADLAPSNNTHLAFDGAGDFQADDYSGRNFHFGIREHAMAAIVNGMTLCGLRAFGATFFVFSDYMRPSMRLAALMNLPSLFIFTHDSIGVGEDGPTHQPVEQLAACRAIPNLIVLRPGDANEVAEAYRTILQTKNQPVALVLTRQNLPTIDREKYADAKNVARGAYILADSPDNTPEVILLATGSELSLAIDAHQQLTADGVKSRVVSMPSWELFEAQEDQYKNSVLPASCLVRIAIEAGIRQGWDRYLGSNGRFIGMNSFGASAPGGELMKHFNLTTQNIIQQAKSVLAVSHG